MKNKARVALLIAVIVQTAWMVFALWRGRLPVVLLAYIALITALSAVLAVTAGRYRWLNICMRVVIGLAFTLSVCDRFGILGKHGAPGVSWGDFEHFVKYTRRVNSFLPASWAPVLAWLATLCETSLGVLLISGFLSRYAQLAATALLFLFGSAMIVSLGWQSQFYFAVSVLASAAFYLFSLDMDRTAQLQSISAGKSSAA